METTARFKMNDLDKMEAELATTILAIHVTDVFKEDHGDLDELTKDLFKIQIPTIKIRKFFYRTVPDTILGVIKEVKKPIYYLETKIVINYPGKGNPSEVKVELFHSKDSWKIRYSTYSDEVELNFNSIGPNVICTPFISTNAWGDICISHKITDSIDPKKIFINFLESLFLDIMLEKRKEYFVGEPDLVKGLKFSGEELISFLMKFQNRLLSGR